MFNNYFDKHLPENNKVLMKNECKILKIKKVCANDYFIYQLDLMHFIDRVYRYQR